MHRFAMAILFLLGLAKGASAAAELAQLGVCADVSTGLTSSSTYHCAPNAGHCREYVAENKPEGCAPRTETPCVEEVLAEHWHDAAVAAEAGIDCTCAYGNPKDDEHFMRTDNCYNMEAAHAVRCMGDVSICPLSSGYQMGTYYIPRDEEAWPCGCYSGGSPDRFTEWGACYDKVKLEGHCSAHANDCSEDEEYYVPLSDDLLSVDMYCPCWEVRTGSCYDGTAHKQTCAASEDVCGEGQMWLDPRKTLEYDKECRMCAKADDHIDPLPKDDHSDHDEEVEVEEEEEDEDGVHRVGVAMSIATAAGMTLVA